MKPIKTILLITLELVFSLGIAIFGTSLLTPRKPVYDLNTSIIIGFFAFCVFAFIGIGIPGYFHSRMNDENKKYGIGMAKAALGIVIGLIIGGILSSVLSDFLHHHLHKVVLFFTPILFGVIGFNNEMR